MLLFLKAPPITGAPTPDPGAECDRNIIQREKLPIIFKNFFVLSTVFLSCGQCISAAATTPRKCDWCENPNIVGDGKCHEKVLCFDLN